MKEKKRLVATTYDIALIGVMIAIIEVCKMQLLALPNIELTSFWIIMFTLFFGKKILFVIPAFILIEGSMFGFHIWWFMYAYMWPGLALLTWLNRKVNSTLFWSVLSGFFGLFFGLFCSIPYLFIGMGKGGLRAGLYAAFTWWIAGIPYDIVHCIGNFTLMLILYRPVRKVMKTVNGFIHN